MNYLSQKSFEKCVITSWGQKILVQVIKDNNLVKIVYDDLHNGIVWYKE